MRLTLILTIFAVVLAGCLPQAKQQSCGSGNVFNPTSRSCVPITSGGTTSGVVISAKSPVGTNLTVSKTQTAVSAFNVTVTDTLNQGYSIRWMLYPPDGVTFNGNPVALSTSSYSLIPNNLSMATGLWTLAAEIYDGSGITQITSAQWAISVTGAPTPTLSVNASSTISGSTASRLITDTTIDNMVVNITDSAGNTSWTLKWYYDGQLMSTAAGSGTSNSHAQAFFSTTNALAADNPPIQVGTHLLRAELSNGSGTTYDTKEWTIYAYTASMPQVSTTSPPLPDTSTVMSAINGVSLASGGFTSSGVNIYPASDFCVAVNDFDGTRNDGLPGGVTVQFKRNGSLQGAPLVFTANHSYLCLGDGTPTFNLTLTNPSVGEFQNVSAIITDVDSGTVAATVTWAASVRPQNTAPVASIVSPATPASHTQGASATYTIAAADDDTTSTDNMGIAFYFDGVALDGINNFPGTSITTPDCTHVAGAAPAGATRLQCTITLPAYNLSGRINPATATYTLTANVVDQTTYGGAPLNSNTVTWTINPALGDTTPVIGTQGVTITTPSTGTAAAAAGNSYIALLALPTTPIVAPTTVAEGTSVLFNVLVKDDQRDKFTLQIDRCLDVLCASVTNVAPAFLVTRSTDNVGKRATYSYQLPEDLVTGMASDTITYQVTVRDQLPDGTQGAAVTSTMVLTVSNNNPFPLWAGASGTNPGVGDSLSIVAGMPLTLDPGTITDASTDDGSTILYQWEVSIDAGITWTTIPGATSKVLKWTPGNALDGASVRLRLCLGDDGFGNDLTLCTGLAAPTAPSLPATTRVAGPWTAITARANSIAKSAATATLNGDAATWFDAADRAFYMAYINNNGTDDSSIVLEKYAVATNGSMALERTLTFKSERTAPYYDASNISLVGQSKTVGSKTYKGLYVSYVTQSTSALVSPKLRIRHVDLTDGLMLFSYSGFTESDLTTTNISVTEGTTAGDVTMQVIDTAFDAGEYLTYNGVVLTAVSSLTAPDDCEFQGDNTLTTAQVASNIETAYGVCTVATSDARTFVPDTAVVGDTWHPTNMPQDWVDLGYALYLGKRGGVMLQSDYILLPFLDNLNSGKLSVAVIATLTGGFTSGSLAKTTGTYAQIPTYVTVSTTVPGQDMAASHNDTANFDVAMVTSTSGLNAYRLTFTAPSTITVSSAITNVFGTGVFVQNPRIASGASATNNHVFILAQDSSVVTNDLMFARIDASTYALAPGMPVIPLDAAHEQTSDLAAYRVRALSGNKRAAMGVITNGGDVLVSIIKPTTLSLDSPMVRPVAGGAGSNYPVVDSSVSIVVPSLGMSEAATFETGDPGATAAENSKESLVLFHPSSAATGFSATFLNVTEETIQATSVSGTGLFQPPYIK